ITVAGDDWTIIVSLTTGTKFNEEPLSNIKKKKFISDIAKRIVKY
ncbi:32300_t:CDS:2, partial [Gigaspora margarita]